MALDAAPASLGAMGRAPEISGDPASPSVSYLYAGGNRPAGGEYSAGNTVAYRNGGATKKVSGRTPVGYYIAGTASLLLPLMEVDGAAISSDDRELNDRIAPYLRARGMDDLYERMLDRVERSCGRAGVQGVLSILWGARLGMEEENIVAISGLKGDVVGRVLPALENHLTRHGSRITILRDELCDAVERRYLGSGARQQKLRVAIAEHFAGAAIDPRRLDEEPWQWMHADRHDRLRACVVSVAMTMALILQERREELFLYWQAIEGSCNLVAEYERVLERHDPSDGGERAEIFHALSDFYAGSYRYDLAKSLLERCIGASGKEGGARTSAGSELDDLLWRGVDFVSEISSSTPQARSAGHTPSLMRRGF